MKIFWSWQSDTPGKMGRFLVRDALKDAIDQLKQAPDIEEPTTRESREALHLDQDIQGVTGSPDLARTIFDKIDLSEVVVADVTIVGNIQDITSTQDTKVARKKLINSNVAIELGYALRALTDRNVILVFNGHYGTHEDLPFDLRHKGGSIVFNLPPNADRRLIEEERKKLASRFAGALRPYLQKTAASSTPFAETPSTFSKAAYFQKDEVLARAGEVTFSYVTDCLCYLRLIPTSPLARPLLLATLKESVIRAPLLGSSHLGFYDHYDHNEHGAIGCEPGTNPPRGPAELNASTQLFQNGEIWCIGATLIISERDGRPAWLKLPCIPCLPLEQAYYDTLGSLVRFAADLGLGPPWIVESGIVGTKGVYLIYGQNMQRGPILKPEIIQRAVLKDDKRASLDTLLLDFLSQIYDATGRSRPANLGGFPPGRPSER